MFSKLFVVLVATFAIFVAAAPTPNNDIKDSCNTDDMYCCEDTFTADSEEGKNIKNFLKIDIPANTKIGATCTPLSVLAIGGNSCTQQPVCCTGNDFSGAVVIGCSPINVNL